mgnify:CR=1 FL=1
MSIQRDSQYAESPFGFILKGEFVHEFLIALIAGVVAGMTMNILERLVWHRAEFKAILTATKEQIKEK